MNIKVELLEGNQLEVGERKEKEEGYDALYAWQHRKRSYEASLKILQQSLKRG
jgi:hypothetical protein